MVKSEYLKFRIMRGGSLEWAGKGTVRFDGTLNLDN
jgi:hypothetical protein